MSETEKTSKPEFGAGIGVGVALGLLFGTALGSPAMGLILGIALGYAGSLVSAGQKPKDSRTSSD